MPDVEVCAWPGCGKPFGDPVHRPTEPGVEYHAPMPAVLPDDDVPITTVPLDVAAAVGEQVIRAICKHRWAPGEEGGEYDVEWLLDDTALTFSGVLDLDREVIEKIRDLLP
jgi:hypothetical protein